MNFLSGTLADEARLNESQHRFSCEQGSSRELAELVFPRDC
jgi:hypothetical protein